MDAFVTFLEWKNNNMEKYNIEIDWEVVASKQSVEKLNDRIAKLEKIVEKLDTQIQTIVDIQQRMMEWVKNK